MQLLDLTLNSSADNLALDEALLEEAEARFDKAPENRAAEVLRIWEPRDFMVVVGSSSRVAEEVDLEVCRAQGVPVMRRASGGCAIVAGPGCLMYSVVLSYAGRSHLRFIDQAHQHVLGPITRSLKELFGINAIRAGISDLVCDDRKISGNSLRCKRNFFLYHGTLLYNFPLVRVSKLLKMPGRQPEYRQHRPHADFITNLSLDADSLRRVLISAFDASERRWTWPLQLTATLVEKKYGSEEWNLKL